MLHFLLFRFPSMITYVESILSTITQYLPDSFPAILTHNWPIIFYFFLLFPFLSILNIEFPRTFFQAFSWTLALSSSCKAFHEAFPSEQHRILHNGLAWVFSFYKPV